MDEIGIYGKLVSKTVDGVLAQADQIKDVQSGKMQSEINADVRGIASGLGSETDTRSRQVAALEQSKLDKTAIVVLSESEAPEEKDEDVFYFLYEDDEDGEPQAPAEQEQQTGDEE